MTAEMPLCDLGCGTELLPPPDDGYLYWCEKCCEHRDPFVVHDFNRTERQVWIRSRTVSYSTVLRKGQLLPDGKVRGMPDVTWEKWP